MEKHKLETKNYKIIFREDENCILYGILDKKNNQIVVYEENILDALDTMHFYEQQKYLNELKILKGE